MKARLNVLPSLFLLWACVFGIAACGKDGLAVVEVQGPTMGTFYTVKVVAPERDLPDVDVLQSWADDILQTINQSMSTYVADSELSKFNRSASDEWQQISPGLLHVLLLSQEISRLSDGAFDITVAPLVDLWGFGPEMRAETKPSEQEIAAEKARLGYQHIAIDEERLAARKPVGLTLDLSAIAKGYAADELANYIEAQGFSNIMVEVGGELSLRGVSVRNSPWRIGIETPAYQVLGAPSVPAKTVELSDRGMATSGDYRNYYELDGERVSHTIDPVTGRPIAHALASVTVIADTAAEADGWATALNVLGPQRAPMLAESLGIAALFIVREGEGFETVFSPAFAPFLD